MTNNRYSSFADLHATGAFSSDVESTFDGAFIEHTELAKMSITGEPAAIAMPDADQARACVEQIIGNVFDVFRDTRMEEYGAQIVWGIVNSFHHTARMCEGREDDAARKLGDLARTFDPSEIYATEMEETQILCQTLQGCREALEAMRDYASRCYHVETGHPFRSARGSQVSNAGVTNSQIEARDYLAARNRKRQEQHTPTGPVVVVSGGQDWTDINTIYRDLDQAHKRTPNMTIASTGMRKGADAIANSWAASRMVPIVHFIPNTKLGKRAAFVRNDTMVGLNPIGALIYGGTGIQGNLVDKLRQKGIGVKACKVEKEKVADERAA